MSKIPKRKKEQRRAATGVNSGSLLSVCLNCGEKGPHYYPPGLGTPGGWICEKKEDNDEPA